jgi:hypothetical protein
MPGEENPTTAVPGLTPTLPLMTVVPVLVTVDPARTPNVSRLCAAAGLLANSEIRTGATVAKANFGGKRVIVLYLTRIAASDEHESRAGDARTLVRQT